MNKILQEKGEITPIISDLRGILLGKCHTFLLAKVLYEFVR